MKAVVFLFYLYYKWERCWEGEWERLVRGGWVRGVDLDCDKMGNQEFFCGGIFKGCGFGLVNEKSEKA